MSGCPLSSTSAVLWAKSAIITINHNGLIQSADKGAAHMFGHAMEDLIGKNIRIIVPTPYKEQHDMYMQNYLNTGEKKVIGRSRLVEGQHKDGTVFPLRLNVSEAEIMGQKLFIGVLDRVEDFDGVVKATPEGVIVSTNSAIDRLFGYSSSELVGKSVSCLMPEPYRSHHDSYLERWRKSSDNQGAFTYHVLGKVRNFLGVKKDGTLFPISLHVTTMTVGTNDRWLRANITGSMEGMAVMTVSEKGVITSCTQTYIESIAGSYSDSLIGKNISSLLTPASGKFQFLLTSSSSTSSTTPSAYDNSFAAYRQQHNQPLSSSSTSASTSTSTSTTTSTSSTTTASNDDNSNNNNNSNNDNSNNDNSNNVNGENNMDENNIEGAFKDGKLASSGSFTVPGSETTPSLRLTSASSENVPPWKEGGVMCLRHSDGSEIPVEVRCYPFFCEGEATLQYSLSIQRLSLDVDSLSSSEFKSGSGGSQTLAMQMQGSSSLAQRQMSNYVLDKKIGRGSYGVVRLAYNRETGNKVAIKIVHRDLINDDELRRTSQEVEIMRRVNHPYVTKLYETINTGTELYIVMEYNSGGDLATYSERATKLPREEALRLFTQLCLALEYCHNNNIIHRDLSTRNVLLDSKCNIKLIDFGLSTFVTEGNLRSTFCGTPKFAAPEMIAGERYVGPPVDIWSLGTILFKILTGHFPFQTVVDIIKVRYSFPKGVDSELRALFRRIFLAKSSDRITIREILALPFMDQAEIATVQDHCYDLHPPSDKLPFFESFSESDSSTTASSNGSSKNSPNISERSPPDSPPPSPASDDSKHIASSSSSSLPANKRARNAALESLANASAKRQK